jgi:hypothetical protein
MPVRAFALLNADTDPATEIAVITEANTLFMTWVDGAYNASQQRHENPRGKEDYVVRARRGRGGGGDVNNDGIDDLIIGSSLSNVVSVYRGGATTPGNLFPKRFELTLHAARGEPATRCRWAI